jgi:hypoxanthine phosphoribosyltransferase
LSLTIEDPGQPRLGQHNLGVQRSADLAEGQGHLDLALQNTAGLALQNTGDPELQSTVGLALQNTAGLALQNTAGLKERLVSNDYAHSLLERCWFPAPGESLDCACSGGADSTALVLLAVLAGCEVRVHHVDHGLRSNGEKEATLVRELSLSLGLPFFLHRVQVEPGPNLEARARHARFAALPAGFATGHSADDLAETVLIRLMRGTGIDGLGAMRPGPRHPILSLRRAETRELCSRLGICWVEDPSNEDMAFVRNRVRHELLPLMADISRRDPVPLLARLSELASGEVALLDELAAGLDPSSLAELQQAPRQVAARALRKWLTSQAGYPPDSKGLERVFGILEGRINATELAGVGQVKARRGRLVISPRSAQMGSVKLPSADMESSSERKGTSPTEESAAKTRPGTSPTEESTEPLIPDPLLGEVVVPSASIERRIAELGSEITQDYAGKSPLLVGILKGAFVFVSDLARQIALPVELDFMAVSSYGSATTSSGVVRILKDLDQDLTGRHVLIVEDIVDSGLTLAYLRRSLMARGPASLQVCSLLVKEGQQRADLDITYVGFSIPPVFVVGYGLDVAERYRNLPDIRMFKGGEPAAAGGSQD